MGWEFGLVDYSIHIIRVNKIINENVYRKYINIHNKLN